jgi:hypothetical protein
MGCNILAFKLYRQTWHSIFVLKLGGHGSFDGHGRQKPIHLRQDHALHRQA